MIIWPPSPTPCPALLAPETRAASRTADDVDCAARGHRPCRGQWPKQCALYILVHSSHRVEGERVTRFGKDSGVSPFFSVLENRGVAGLFTESYQGLLVSFPLSWRPRFSPRFGPQFSLPSHLLPCPPCFVHSRQVSETGGPRHHPRFNGRAVSFYHLYRLERAGCRILSYVFYFCPGLDGFWAAQGRYVTRGFSTFKLPSKQTSIRPSLLIALNCGYRCQCAHVSVPVCDHERFQESKWVSSKCRLMVDR